MKPFLKWAGGKYRLLSTILKHLPPEGERLVEPFGGSGALFLNAPYSQFLIAEINLDLVILYQQLQSERGEFIEYCRPLFTEQTNQAGFYYEKRAEFNQCQEPRQRAALFLYLNRHGYNGLCRYNQHGQFNVPFGRYRKPYFPEQEMLHFCCKSQHATFVHQDFRQTFATLLPTDVIYCDPPYAHFSKSASFTHYTSKNFQEADHIHLTYLAQEARQQGHHVVISNHDTPFTRAQYANCQIESFSVKRLISCKTEGGRLEAKELMAIFHPDAN